MFAIRLDNPQEKGRQGAPCGVVLFGLLPYTCRLGEFQFVRSASRLPFNVRQRGHDSLNPAMHHTQSDGAQIAFTAAGLPAPKRSGELRFAIGQ
jgi:hypothetical protein